jgi:hypothetical protein
MRSPDVQQLGVFSYVFVEDRVPADLPSRKQRVLVDAILASSMGCLGALCWSALPLCAAG